MKSELGEQIKARFDLRITPLADVHFQKDELSYDRPKGNMNYVYIMGIMGILLIVIASINYTNLTTARPTNRSKEIAIRKVAGAGKNLLVAQFLGESVVLAIAAGILASFNPVSILQGNGISSSDRGWLRRGLVIVQFLISAVMVIGSIIISMQMRFIQSKDLGFDEDQILLISLNDTAVVNNANAFMEESLDLTRPIQWW